MMRKIGLILIALIIALGGSGVAYASWNDTLQASGAIEVEDCWVDFCSVSSNDPCQTPDPGTDPAKHVAKTEAKIKDGCRRCRCTCFYRPNTLLVTITNAYPSYQPTVEFGVKAYARWSCAQLAGIEIDGTEAEPGEPFPLYDGKLFVTVNPPLTIYPCHCACGCETGNMTIHVEQSAEECKTKCNSYKFKVTMYYNFTCCQ
jgi:predicted ribosomally synthesized peptide with SipW-like signal peptide